MHQGLEQQMPSFNLPSKILCKVVNIHLRVSNYFAVQAYCVIFFLAINHLLWNWLCFTIDILVVQAEPETDEVYAQITLFPEADVSAHLFSIYSMNFSHCPFNSLNMQLSCPIPVHIQKRHSLMNSMSSMKKSQPNSCPQDV